MEFLNVPDSYYDMLKDRLNNSKVKIAEDMKILQVLYIIFKENNNLLIVNCFS